MFIIDSVTRQAFRLGMAVLPVFVKPGTFDRADDLDSKVYDFISSLVS